jgi:hypothetical protein
MTKKVFLFGNDNWLYCSAVSFHDGIWRGHVENGYWHLVYNSIANIFEAYKSEEEEKLGWKPVNEGNAILTWICDPQGDYYNSVISNAKMRYKDEEPANFTIGPDKDLELYQKLKSKYEDNDEYDLYLELRDKYEDNDDGVPF